MPVGVRAAAPTHRRREPASTPQGAGAVCNGLTNAASFADVLTPTGEGDTNAPALERLFMGDKIGDEGAERLRSCSPLTRISSARKDEGPPSICFSAFNPKLTPLVLRAIAPGRRHRDRARRRAGPAGGHPVSESPARVRLWQPFNTTSGGSRRRLLPARPGAELLNEVVTAINTATRT